MEQLEKLPKGKSCSDCKWSDKCKVQFGNEDSNDYCQFAPSRFAAKIPEPLRTAAQNTRLFVLLNQLSWIHYREDLALQYSEGRTKKTSQLTIKECDALIRRLQDEINLNIPESQKKMLSKFFAICHDLGWEVGGGKLDYARINNWLLKYSYLKKGINDYKASELPKLLHQIEKLVANGKEEKDN